jgi:hypothetical protein
MLDADFIYGFKNCPLGYEKAKYGSVGISESPNGSAWVGPIVTSFSFMFAVADRHGSVRVNQELCYSHIFGGPREKKCYFMESWNICI